MRLKFAMCRWNLPVSKGRVSRAYNRSEKVYAARMGKDKTHIRSLWAYTKEAREMNEDVRPISL